MLVVFSLQASQRAQAHARLLEATEVASLALIASPKTNQDDNVKYARQLVDRYIDNNINDIDVRVYTKKCEYKDGCVQASGELAPFSDFVVGATSKHKSWISYADTAMTSEFQVAGKSVTRKYLPQPVDVYFIGDFSSSMTYDWKGGKSKLDVVKQTIKRVVEDIENFNTEEKSRVALVGYNTHHVKQTDEVVVMHHAESTEGIKSGRWPKKTVYDYKRNMPSETVQKMFDKPQIRFQTMDYRPGMSRDEVYRVWYNNEQILADYYNYYDIPLTEDYNEFKQRLMSSELGAAGGTASWNGIIAAAQEASRATNINPEQVFIVLSDGHDNEEEYLQRLVDKGLCKKLRETISSKRNRFQGKGSAAGKTKVTMGVIGINYIVNETNGFGDCFGRKNIYHAKDGDDVYKYILNLINEETGRLKD
ncbi:pilus assembly protein TadG [Vibrio sp. JPW-9-11-11]|nr:pilus assembly protein TadG [Vibrio sp. JPW-9-11-11]